MDLGAHYFSDKPIWLVNVGDLDWIKLVQNTVTKRLFWECGVCLLPSPWKIAFKLGMGGFGSMLIPKIMIDVFNLRSIIAWTLDVIWKTSIVSIVPVMMFWFFMKAGLLHSCYKVNVFQISTLGLGKDYSRAFGQHIFCSVIGCNAM